MDAKDKTMGGAGEPAANAEVVVPSDDSELSTVSRALYVGGGGDLAVVMLGGSEVIFSAVIAGTVLPIRVKKVKLTGTNASFVLNLY